VIVAIDGPAGSGKSTVARQVAERLGMGYLDTGAMYRAVTFLAIRDGIDPGAGERLAEVARTHRLQMVPNHGGMAIAVDGTDITREIRRPEVTVCVSAVAANPGVREAVTAVQREVLGQGSWVCDGRDIGTTVWPQAELKVFLTASVAERARRRCAELAARGTPEALEDVQAAIAARDHQDTTRVASPLRAAADAIRLDTSNLSIDQVVQRVVGWAEAARHGVGR
jgi:cytidylate kinase